MNRHVRVRYFDIGSPALQQSQAHRLLIEGRAATRQVLYGDAWKAQLTVAVGDGATLYVERFGPKDSMSERELRRFVDDLAASVLKGQQAASRGSAH
ncbi:hypothetical protein [Streptomyces collinus]|uniref:hypothetical protein n=1 Tax=Streptomyces collinus TaxID=42684 RepID=UPI0033E0F083